MNISEVKRTIRDGNRAVADGQATLRQAAAEADVAEHLAQVTLHDSQHRDVQAGLKKLKEARREVELTMRRFDAAVKHANAYLSLIR